MAARRQMVQSSPEISRFLLENVRPTGRTLGVSSYGSVDEVEVDGLICTGWAGIDRCVIFLICYCLLSSSLPGPSLTLMSVADTVDCKSLVMTLQGTCSN